MFTSLLAGIVTGALFLAAPLAAQTVNVTLETGDGDLSVSGRLLVSRNDRLVVATQVGNLELTPDEVSCSGRACPVIGPLPNQVVPQRMRRIELSSIDKMIDVQGELRGVVNERLIVEVRGIGLVSLSPRGLRCSGPGCRVTAAMIEALEPIAVPSAVSPIQIVGAQDLMDGLLTPLLAGYAAQKHVRSEQRRLSGATSQVSLEQNSGMFFLSGTNPSVAFAALASGAADFAITARPPSEGEVAALVAAGLGDLRGTASETMLAVDGLRIVTHPALGLSELTIAQLGAIYRGEITNWSAVGGPDQPITVLAREPGSGEYEIFNKAISGMAQAGPMRSAIIVSSTKDMVDILAATPYALGYVWEAFSDGLGSVDLVGSCGIKSADNIFAYRTGDGALAARFYLYANPETQTDAAKAFAQYADSAAAQAALSQTRFDVLGISRVPLAVMPAYARATPAEPELRAQLGARLIIEAEKWDRLSATYRIAQDGQTLLLSGGASEAQLLNYLEKTAQADQIAVIGFGSGEGDFAQTVEASVADAARVADHLAAAGKTQLAGKTVVSAGYGSVGHLFCEEDAIGARLNRRVEIWVPKLE
ncbi:MAG: substrate-binding domain-containing protein [Sulfitobacter sp.]